MKKLLALVAALSVGSAYAQMSDSSSSSQGGFFNIEEQQATAEAGQRHMIEFNAESVPSLVYAFTKDKTKGTDSDADSDLNFSMNYAYTIHPNVQVGGRFNYFNGIRNGANNDTESLNASVAGWLNSKAGDLQNSAFISAALGAGYAQTFGSNGGRDDLILSSVSVGKRFGMERWGVKALTWTPEVALTHVNSTADSSFDYQQALEFRVVQFSVIW